MELYALEPVLNNESNSLQLLGFENVLKAYQEQVKKYKNLVVTEDALVEARNDRAYLNKKKKEIDDLRKSTIKELTETFSNQCKQIASAIDEATSNIDAQIKSYEEKYALEKKEKIVELFNSKGNEDLEFNTIFNQKWLNKTYTLSNIEKEIDGILDTFKKNSDILAQMAKTTAEFKVALDVLKVTLDLTKAVAEINKFRETAELIKNEKKIEQRTTTQSLDEPKHKIGFVIEATANQINKLNAFLKENNIGFKQISKDIVETI